MQSKKKRGQDDEALALLREFVACFESFGRSLGASLQGWDNPRLHVVRDKALALLEKTDEARGG